MPAPEVPGDLRAEVGVAHEAGAVERPGTRGAADVPLATLRQRDLDDPDGVVGGDPGGAGVTTGVAGGTGVGTGSAMGAGVGTGSAMTGAGSVATGAGSTMTGPASGPGRR